MRFSFNFNFIKIVLFSFILLLATLPHPSDAKGGGAVHKFRVHNGVTNPRLPKGR